MKNKFSYLLIILIIFIMSCVVVSADETYPNLGGANYDYYAGFGLWNLNFDTFSQSGFKTLNTGANRYPLVADLDNDSENEILIYVDSTRYFYVYKNNNLQLQTSKQLSTVCYSQPIIYDIDGDGFNEIICAGGEATSNVSIYDYNGTINLEKTFALAAGGSQTAIKCESSNNCLVLINPNSNGDCYYGKKYIVQLINSSNVIKTNYLPTPYSSACTSYYSYTGRVYYCFPSKDYNNLISYGNFGSGENWAVLVSSHAYFSGGLTLYIKILNSNLNETHTTSITSGISASSGTCDSQYTYLASTNLLVDDFAGDGGTDEIVVGYMTTTTTTALKIFDSTLGTLDTINMLTESQKISNLVQGDFFDDNDEHVEDKDDFCYLGYNIINKFISLQCGSLTNTEVLSHKLETLEYSTFEFPSWAKDQFASFIHSGQTNTELEGITNIDEIYTTYGTFHLDLDGFNELELLWTFSDNSYHNSTVIPVDVTKKSGNDLLLLQDHETYDYLYYISDGYVNKACVISGDSVIIDPNFNTTWCLNTTVEVSYYATDQEYNSIDYEALLYYGTAYQQNITYSDVASGTYPPQFTFKANVSGLGKQLKLRAKDSENGEWKELNYYFSVGLTNCINYGEGHIYRGSDPVHINKTEIIINETDIKKVQDFFTGYGSIGSQWLPFIAIIIIMIAGMFVVIKLGGVGLNGTVVVVIGGIVMIGLWITFVIFKMIPGWTVIVGILFTAGLLAFKFHQANTGGV